MGLTASEFKAKYGETAAACSARCDGLDENVILAQFAIETGWGTSPLCLDHNNLAGISHYNGWANAGGFCSFPNLNDFAVAYGQVMNNGYYSEVLAAAKSGASADAQAEALGNSPWAASHYELNGQKGGSLIAILGEFGSSPAQTPTPSPAPATTSTVDGRRAYTVQSGDNLSVIAQRFNLTLADVEKWNPQFAPDYSLIHPGDIVYLETTPLSTSTDASTYATSTEPNLPSVLSAPGKYQYSAIPLQLGKPPSNMIFFNAGDTPASVWIQWASQFRPVGSNPQDYLYTKVVEELGIGAHGNTGTTVAVGPYYLILSNEPISMKGEYTFTQIADPNGPIDPVVIAPPSTPAPTIVVSTTATAEAAQLNTLADQLVSAANTLKSIAIEISK